MFLEVFVWNVAKIAFLVRAIQFVYNANKTQHWIVAISADVILQNVKNASIKETNAFDVQRAMVWMKQLIVVKHVTQQFVNTVILQITLIVFHVQMDITLKEIIHARYVWIIVFYALLNFLANSAMKHFIFTKSIENVNFAHNYVPIAFGMNKQNVLDA